MLFLALFLASSLIIFNQNKKEQFDMNIRSNINFLTKNQTQNFFIADTDHYNESLTKFDLIALKTKSKSSYLQTILNSADNFTNKEKKRLESAAKKADLFFENFLEITNEFTPYFDNIKCKKLEWNFAKTLNHIYQEGLPHTRQNLIFLTDDIINKTNDNILIMILIHEKVHIYERTYPQDVQKIFHLFGYTPYNQLSNYSMARSNPDVDRIVYKDNKGNLTYAKYKSSTPNSLFDVIFPIPYSAESEHPNEYLAYYIDGLQRKICKKNKNNIYCNL